VTAVPVARRYALLAAADALDADDHWLQALIADDGPDAPLTAAQVVASLRVLASLDWRHMPALEAAK
jgi:hypothetical protein